MKIQVNQVNEHRFAPDIWGNLKQAEGAQFAFFLKRTNSFLTSQRWSSMRQERGKLVFESNFAEKIKLNVVRIVNPPILEIKGKEPREMTLDDILSDDFPELYDLARMLWDEIQKIEDVAEFETKK